MGGCGARSEEVWVDVVPEGRSVGGCGAKSEEVWVDVVLEVKECGWMWCQK